MDLISALLSNLLDFIAKGVGSFGVSIIIITLCLKMVLAPFNIKQMKISKLMNVINKEVAVSLETREFETQEEKLKFKGEIEDSFLRKYNISKKGSCFFSLFNMILQIGLLFSFYMVIRDNSEISKEHFLWFKLGEVDNSLLLPLLTGLIYMVYFYINSQLSSNKKIAMIIGGVISIFVILLGKSVPSVLYVYWLTSNFFMIFVLLYTKYKIERILERR